MSVLVVGYLVPEPSIEELCATDRMPPMQTHRFMVGFVEALDLGAANPVDLLSFLPTNDYPQGPRIWVPFRRWSARRKAVWWGAPFINVFPLKHLTRFSSALALGLLWCFVRLAQRKTIVVVSAATPQLMAVWLVARLSRAKFVPCLMDPPSVELATDTGVKRLARRLDRRLAEALLAKGDAVIAVTRPLAGKFVPNRPAMLFEGTGPGLTDTKPADRHEPRFVCAYAGALGDAYGLPLLLDAYRLLDPSRHALWIFGKGDGEEAVRAAARECEHIQFYGFLTAGLDERLRSADLLLMVRPSQGSDSEFVFPSKILYSMALGVPTAVTRLKAIPEEYFEQLYTLDDADAASLAASLEAIRTLPSEERQTRADRMRAFVTERKSSSATGAALWGFLEGLALGTPRSGSPSGTATGR